MSLTLKANLDKLSSSAGFVKPDSYIGNSDQDIAQIVECTNEAALYIEELGLQTIRKTWSLPLTSSETYSLPADYLGFISATAYQYGRWDRIDLPTTEEEWALLKSVVSVSTLPIRARIIGDTFHILNPQAGATINIEYYSNGAIAYYGFPGGSAPYNSEFSNDLDIWLLDDLLLRLETKWRFKKEKGLPEWQVDLELAKNHRDAVRGRTNANGPIVPNQVAVTGQPYTNLWVPPT